MKASGYSMSEADEALRDEYRKLKAKIRRLANRQPYVNDEKMQAAFAALDKFEKDHKGRI